jgi:hypothetical protein
MDKEIGSNKLKQLTYEYLVSINNRYTRQDVNIIVGVFIGVMKNVLLERYSIKIRNFLHLRLFRNGQIRTYLNHPKGFNSGVAESSIKIKETVAAKRPKLKAFLSQKFERAIITQIPPDED